jgi:hypothetical protein
MSTEGLCLWMDKCPDIYLKHLISGAISQAVNSPALMIYPFWLFPF